MSRNNSAKKQGFLTWFSGTFVLGLHRGPRAEEARFAIPPAEEGGGRYWMTEAIHRYFVHEQEGCNDPGYANRGADGWRCLCQRITGAVDSRAVGTRRSPSMPAA